MDTPTDKPLQQQIRQLQEQLKAVKQQQDDLNVRLLEALTKRDISTVNECIRKGPDINAVWHPAVRTGYPEGVKALLDAGADVNAIDKKSGYAALHWAARTNNTKLIDVLLGSPTVQVDINAEYSKPEGLGSSEFPAGMLTPLHVALLGNCSAAVKLLKSKDADINKTADSGPTILSYSFELIAKSKSTTPLQTLLDNGADPNIGRISGRDSVLNMAVRIAETVRDSYPDCDEAQVDGLKLLLERGGDPNMPHTYAQGTALHELARDARFDTRDVIFRCVDLLLKHGANPEAKDRSGLTPLESVTYPDGRSAQKHPNAQKIVQLLRDAQSKQANSKESPDFLKLLGDLFGQNGR